MAQPGAWAMGGRVGSLTVQTAPSAMPVRVRPPWVVGTVTAWLVGPPGVQFTVMAKLGKLGGTGKPAV